MLRNLSCRWQLKQCFCMSSSRLFDCMCVILAFGIECAALHLMCLNAKVLHLPTNLLADIDRRPMSVIASGESTTSLLFNCCDIVGNVLSRKGECGLVHIWERTTAGCERHNWSGMEATGRNEKHCLHDWRGKDGVRFWFLLAECHL